MHRVPELLAPAGTLEKLKVAILYGADAVYLGGQQFGLRTASDNFTHDQLREGVMFARQRNVKVYVVLNSFLHDKDLSELPEFLQLLDELAIDAVIVSDIGVIKTVRKHSNLTIHLSTQASCLNSYAARMYKSLGVERIVLGREVSLAEAAKIKKESGLEIEMFIHGSMCMAYSGNCVISNYTQGRDSNRGGCAHSCRFDYKLTDGKETKNSFFMSSKDLNGIRLLKEFIEADIDSLKVEGRMKTHHYAATISKVYAEALAWYREHGDFLSDKLEEWESELAKVSHREYHTGSLESPAGPDSIYQERLHEENEYAVAGVVLEAVAGKYLLAEVRSAFYPGDNLELVPFKGATVNFKLDKIHNVLGEEYEKSKPGTLVKLPWIEGASPWNIIRGRAHL